MADAKTVEVGSRSPAKIIPGRVVSSPYVVVVVEKGVRLLVLPKGSGILGSRDFVRNRDEVAQTPLSCDVSVPPEETLHYSFEETLAYFRRYLGIAIQFWGREKGIAFMLRTLMCNFFDCMHAGLSRPQRQVFMYVAAQLSARTRKRIALYPNTAIPYTRWHTVQDVYCTFLQGGGM